MSADAPLPSRRARCARCDEDRGRGAPIAHPLRDIYRCGRCGYINVAAGQPQALPLPESLGIAGAEALRAQLRGTRAADDDGELLRRIVAALAEAARALIDDAPAYALSNAPRVLWMSESELAKHGGRPQGNDIARSSYAKAASLLFVLSARHGSADLAAPERAAASPAEHAFRESFFAVATDAAATGSLLHLMLRGDASIRIADGTILAEPTGLGLDTDELTLNRRDAAGGDRGGGEEVRALHQALKLRRGIDLKRLIEHVVDAAGKPREGFVLVPRDALSEAARTTLESFELTVERVRRFEDAWFLDLGPKRAAPADDATVATALVTRSWSAYYPVFGALHGSRAVCMLGAHGIAITLDNLMSSKNRLLQELTESIPSSVPAAARQELREIRVGLNRHAEARAGQLLARDGWSASAGEQWQLGRAREEIDVLAARARATHVDVLVGEVKDFDFTLHRISGPSGLSERIRKAEAQLARKQAHVVASIAAVLQRLDVAAGGLPVHVHALVITADAPPPGMFGAADGADFAALARFSQLLDRDRDLARRLFGRATRTVA